MKYAKLVAKKDTWFKEGTEVYNYDYKYEDKKRVTWDYWEQCKSEGGICVRGIRISDMECEIVCGNSNGKEYIDGEYCHWDEFDVTMVDE